METKHWEIMNEGVKKALKGRLTRRQVVKAGALAALGLAFSKPLIDTIRPLPLFSQYGNPSPDWDAGGTGYDDLEFVTPTLSFPNGNIVFVTPTPASLCNTGDSPGDVMENATFTKELVKNKQFISGADDTAKKANIILLDELGDPIDEANFGELAAGACRDIDVKIFLTQAWIDSDPETELKVRIIISATNRKTGLPNHATLTVTLVR